MQNVMNIKERIESFSDVDLGKLLQGLSDVLSTVDIGEGDAWRLLSEIELVAIKEQDSRSPTGGLPEEIQAGAGHQVNDWSS